MRSLDDAILAVLNRDPGSTAHHVAQELGCTTGLINRQLAKLLQQADTRREGTYRAGWYAKRSVGISAIGEYLAGPPTLTDRFWQYVNKSGPVVEHVGTPCWLWTSAIGTWGYGILRDGGRGGRNVATHRYSWELHNGTIPTGVRVLHKCDIPACVNPEHLYLGTDKDNAQDRERRGRRVPARGMQNGAHTHSERRPRALTHGQRRIDFEVADAIRKDYATGKYRQKDVAAKHGVSQCTVWAIVNNQRWVR